MVVGNTCVKGGIRVDCLQSSQQACESKGCCWDPINKDKEEGKVGGVPWCYKQNPAVKGYELVSVKNTPNGLSGLLRVYDPTPLYGPDIQTLSFDVMMETESRIRVKITDSANQRWEVPNVVKTSAPVNKPTNTNYDFSYTSKPFGFAIRRKSNNEVIFNTTSNPQSPFNGLIFKDQYIEISSQLDNRSPLNVYGLGEHIVSLRLPLNSMYTLFAADRGTPKNTNLYGVHPFYLSHNSATLSSNGVFLLNSNGMDIYLSENSITYRTIGGVLDFYFFTGPHPEDVIQQYHQVIGTPYLPPLWSLGFHQCRWGYKTIGDVQTVVDKYRSNNIPLDTMWNDIDYMDKYYGFTYDPVNYPENQVQAFVNNLNQNHQHYVVITECGIPKPNIPNYAPWNDAIAMNVFLKNPAGQPFIGQVWPGLTSWPDYTHVNATKYWTKQIQTFLQTKAAASGLWLDMNEASNFCNGACGPNQLAKSRGVTSSSPPALPSSVSPATSSYREGFDPVNPPYPINNGNSREALNTKAIAMDTRGSYTIQYNAHSMYGMTEANVTRAVLEQVRGKRAFVLSRSTFAGHGHYAAHWLGDNVSDYDDLYEAIPGILSFQMFGVTLVGADICGFGGKSNEELCTRWIQVGAFYPFSRNHNAIGSPSQELYVWPSVAAVSREVLGIRYSLLPYFYTLFAQAHRFGGGVWNPLFFEFSNDTQTFGIDKQFLVGKHILVSPVLTEGATTLRMYVPPSAVWYDFYTGQKATISGWTVVSAPLNKIPIHIRGGSIIPRQTATLTTYETTRSPYELYVALNRSRGASGELFADDGETVGTAQSGNYVELKFMAEEKNNVGRVSVRVAKAGWSQGVQSMVLSKLHVWGVTVKPTSVKLNGQPLSFTYSAGQKLEVSLPTPTKFVQNLEVVWQ